MTSSDDNKLKAPGALIERALNLSRYARRVFNAEPDLLPAASVHTAFGADEMRALLNSTVPLDEKALQQKLRNLRKRVLLRLIVRDLNGLTTLDEVVFTMTALAELTLSISVDHLEQWLTEENGVPIGSDSGNAQKLHVVAMGKFGGHELNVSSDIDLVFVYPEEGETRGSRQLSNHEFFIRYGRRLIALLNEITPEGFVFRVDMRLRPMGSHGPLACSYAMLENYFVTQGREWERYAWIKARVICGDRAQELIELVRPFVFRRHLDYSAFESLRDLHSQVRHEVERRELHDNIKLGPGGIREIEFIVQLFQLVRGGHDSALRELATLAVLPVLAARGLLPESAVQELTEAYVFLRNLEHRLQYLDDQQTQQLPSESSDQELIAIAMGYADYRTLREQLDHHRNCVTQHFERIFAASKDTTHTLAPLWHGGDEAHDIKMLRDLGYENAPATLAHITELRASSRLQQMPEASRTRIDKLVPLIIETAARLPHPDATLERMLRLLEIISRRESYLALLLQFPETIERAARLVGASPWAAQYLTQHPILLDELLDSRMLYLPPDWPHLRNLLRNALQEASGDNERQMDLLRHFKHAQTMRLLAQDLSGALTLEKLSDYLSELADLILAEVLRITWQGLRTRHREEPLFAAIAYGKLGGKELGYASDLDLIFLYKDDAASAPENYARLAQRMISWLNSLTPAGVLYETDLRLRPDGASGLLVSPVDGFAEYQREKAWVWEHQALTRARWAAGDASIGNEFEAIRIAVLRQRRDLAQLRTAIIEMRDKLFAGHPNKSELFDIKHDRGGLIDVEFIVQYLVLGHAVEHPQLTANSGNLALLKLAAQLGLIPSDQAFAAHDAYRRFRSMQHALRLRGDKYARTDGVELLAEISAVKTLWNSVFGGAAT